eukprot:6998720-Lingulodinium_polyedra.AAC.1
MFGPLLSTVEPREAGGAEHGIRGQHIVLMRHEAGNAGAQAVHKHANAAGSHMQAVVCADQIAS